MPIFPGESGLAGCPLNSPSPFIPKLCILDRPKLSMSFLTQVFSGRPLWGTGVGEPTKGVTPSPVWES